MDKIIIDEKIGYKLKKKHKLWYFYSISKNGESEYCFVHNYQKINKLIN